MTDSADRFEHEGVALEKDDGGIWFAVDEAEPRWIGPRTIAALRLSGFIG